MGYLIYHPPRCKLVIDDLTIYHDSFGGNEDPYIWNEKFLHSFCHMTQISNSIGQINFWVSRDTNDKYPKFTKFLCDCVFVVNEIIEWTETNSIEKNAQIIDNEQAFEHHYKWVNPPHNQHNFNSKKKRYTLKADSYKSFQPQDSSKNLIDILQFLNQQCRISTETLVNEIGMTKNGKRAINSKPFKLSEELSKKLYDHLWDISEIKIKGDMIENKHPMIANEN